MDETHEFALLTHVLSTRTFGVAISDHKRVKNPKSSDNLRDHMTDIELILTMLGEKSTKEIAQICDAQGFEEKQSGGAHWRRYCWKCQEVPRSGNQKESCV